MGSLKVTLGEEGVWALWWGWGPKGVCSFVGSVAGTLRKKGEGWEAKQRSYTVCTRHVVMVLDRWALSDRSRISCVEKSSLGDMRVSIYFIGEASETHPERLSI